MALTRTTTVGWYYLVHLVSLTIFLAALRIIKTSSSFRPCRRNGDLRIAGGSSCFTNF